MPPLRHPRALVLLLAVCALCIPHTTLAVAARPLLFSSLSAPVTVHASAFASLSLVRPRLLARHLRLRALLRANQIGLAYDTCTPTLACDTGLSCMLLSDDAAPCPADTAECLCVPEDAAARHCTASPNCPRGERCVRPPATPAVDATQQKKQHQAVCASCFAWDINLVQYTPVDIQPGTCLTAKQYVGGYAGDACADSADLLVPCAGDRVCVRDVVSGSQSACKPGQTDCVCRDPANNSRPVTCAKSSECPAGERCVTGSMDNVCAGCRVAAIDTLLYEPRDTDDSRCVLADVDTAPSSTATTSTKTTTAVMTTSTAKDETATVAATTGDDTATDPVDVASPTSDDSTTIPPTTATTMTSTESAVAAMDSASTATVAAVTTTTTIADTVSSDETTTSTSTDTESVPTEDTGDVDVAKVPTPSPPASSRGGPSNTTSSGPQSSNTTTTAAATEAPVSPSPSDTTAPTAATSSSDTADPASATGSSASSCIAVHHLQEHSAHDLVYRTHRRATVLCDTHGSCATRGHVVSFRGHAMAMRSYCTTHASGGCVARENVAVNSPRWRQQLHRVGPIARGTRVQSLTPGLDFTALAARWETRGEERVLAALVNWFGA